MATIFCASGGSNTAPYETWAKAATSLQTALTAAAAGDVVVLQYDAVPAGDAENGADVTYTFANHCALVTASNGGGSAYTLTAQGTANWIGNSTTNRSVTMAGADLRCLVWGLTIRTAGSTADRILLSSSSGQHMIYDNCYIWQGNTAAGSSSCCISPVSISAYCLLRDSTLRFGATTQFIDINGFCDFENCSISGSGSTPSTLLQFGNLGTYGVMKWTGCDLSLITGTLIGNAAAATEVRFDRCKFGAAVTVLASQTTNPSFGSPRAWVSDCHSGDTHMQWGYYDALGSVIRETGIYYTGGAAGSESWKIVTTSLASYRTPFCTPWQNLYNTATSAITPRFEILRDGSTTAYTDAQVWADFAVKSNANITQAAFFNDKQALASFLAGTTASDQAAGAGLGSWTGEAGSAWSGKCDSGSSVTPAEVGYISGRICVGAASITVYADPVIRTA